MFGMTEHIVEINKKVVEIDVRYCGNHYRLLK